jgi:hypothetical protein
MTNTSSAKQEITVYPKSMMMKIIKTYIKALRE